MLHQKFALPGNIHAHSFLPYVRLINEARWSKRGAWSRVCSISETSELVHCVADLQMSNQKLQEEVRKMKQVLEAMEDSNQKLAEENEELRHKARV